MLAERLGLPRSRIECIVREEIGLSTDTSLRLATFFRTTPGIWINLQQAYELETEAKKLEQELLAIEPIDRAA